jgi:enoyl-CoA hydratase/carnithine racemase
MHYQEIDYRVQEGIATVTLNRPERMNAFTLRMKDELVDALERINEDDTVRVAVVTGSGKAFCAGIEMEAEGHIFGYDEARGREPPLEQIRDSGGEVALAVYRSRKPVIAAINGAAVGVGITMTLPMDFRLAGEGAKIGFVFTQRGIVPEACSSWFLPRLVGMQQAAEWVYTGELFKAEEGERAGLIRSVHPREQVLDAAYELAERIQANTSAVAVAFSRQMLWRNPAFEHPQQAHAVDSRLMYLNSEYLDGRDGFTAFLEKREPVFDAKVSEAVADGYPWWSEPPLR